MEVIQEHLSSSAPYNEETNNCADFTKRLQQALKAANIDANRVAISWEDGGPGHQFVIIQPEYNEQTGDFDGEAYEPQVGRLMGRSVNEAVQQYSTYYGKRPKGVSILPD